MKNKNRQFLARLAGLGLLCCWVLPVHAQLRVLVTNDDGVGAEGISILVEELRKNPNLDITVVAPAGEQSGSGDATSSPIDVTAAFTAAGYPATAVAGEPADSVLFAILELLPQPPDLVISGINDGRNIARDLAPFSGTVGAARWAARLGVPAIAASQERGADPDFQTTAEYVAAIAQVVAQDKLQGTTTIPFDAGDGQGTQIVISVNVPNCPGTLKGFRVVALGSLTSPESYTLTNDDGTTQTYALNEVFNVNPGGCDSPMTDPITDVDALFNGFGAVTPLTESLGISVPDPDDYQVLESVGQGAAGAMELKLPGGGSVFGAASLGLLVLGVALGAWRVRRTGRL
jgi:5'-nucleotidase